VVEVFKTNIRKQAIAKELTKFLRSQFPDWKINFDLQDCDKILRVEGEKIHVYKIIEVVEKHGVTCSVLD
jgi:hypothetical protein